MRGLSGPLELPLRLREHYMLASYLSRQTTLLFRILWAAVDLVENRPALSRWHPDYGERFAAFLKKPQGKQNG